MTTTPNLERPDMDGLDPAELASWQRKPTPNLDATTPLTRHASEHGSYNDLTRACTAEGIDADCPARLHDKARAEADAAGLDFITGAPLARAESVAEQLGTPWRREPAPDSWIIKDQRNFVIGETNWSLEDFHKITDYLVAAVNACAQAGLTLSELTTHGLTALLNRTCEAQREACAKQIESAERDSFDCYGVVDKVRGTALATEAPQ